RLRGGLHLQQPNERRLVLLLERDHVEDAEALAGAEVDLVARMDHLRVGGFARIGTVRNAAAVGVYGFGVVSQGQEVRVGPPRDVLPDPRLRGGSLTSRARVLKGLLVSRSRKSLLAGAAMGKR